MLAPMFCTKNICSAIDQMYTICQASRCLLYTGMIVFCFILSVYSHLNPFCCSIEGGVNFAPELYLLFFDNFFSVFICCYYKLMCWFCYELLFPSLFFSFLLFSRKVELICLLQVTLLHPLLYFYMCERVFVSEQMDEI